LEARGEKIVMSDELKAVAARVKSTVMATLLLTHE
jgi:hypothetical protein